jgi:HAD superfamily hydrolase (TIGR01549 family)
VVLRAVTFDFWSTLVDGTPVPARSAERLAVLHASIVGGGHACTPEEVRAGLRRALQRVTDDARESYIDVGPPGRWAALAKELGVPDGLIDFEVVRHAYEDITLDQLPDPMPHVHGAVEAMKRAGYALGVICNTGMTGGRVLREVLRRHRLLDYFEVTVFSNEFGVAKPHPSIFTHTLEALGGIQPGQALHVGDLEELDIDGARRAGMYSALYTPTADEVQTDANLVVRDWRDFPKLIAGLMCSAKSL